MADFDAGSIIASLELDRDPYTQGLNQAKKQAADFEKSKLTKTVEADTKPADAELDKFDERLDRLREDSPTVTPKVNTKPAEESLARLGAEERAAGSSGKKGSEGISVLVSAIAALAPVATPLLGLGLAIGGGFVSGFAQAAAAIGPFALLAKSDFTDMTTSLKAVQAAQTAAFNATTPQAYAAAIKALSAAQAQLSGPAGTAATAYQHLEAVLKQIKADTAGSVFGVMTAAFNTAARLLPMIEPLVTKTATALMSTVKQLGNGLAGPGVQKFLTMVEKNIAPDLAMVTHLLGAFASGALTLIEDFNPAAQSMLKSVNGVADAFQRWAQNSASGDITKLLDYVHKTGPEVGQTLLALAEAVFHLLKALEPLSGPTLLGLTLLSSAIAHLPVWVVDTLVVALGPLVLAVKTITMLQKGWTGAVNAFQTAQKVVTKTLALFGVEIDLVRIKMIALRVEIALLKAAIWTIQLAQDAWAAAAAVDWVAILGPIALVIAAMALLGVAVYEIIKHWQGLMTFYDLVWRGLKDGFRAVEAVAIDVFDFIKKHWMLIGAILLGPIALATLEIVKHFKTIEGWVKDLPSLIEEAFKGLEDIIFAPWKLAFNMIASAWDSTVGKLSFHLPGWVPGVGGDGFTMPQIPHLAYGGVAKRATTAVIGEDGPEAIVPLDKDTVLSKSQDAQTVMLGKVLQALMQLHAATLAGPAKTARGVGETIGDKFVRAQMQTGLAAAMAGRAG